MYRVRIRIKFYFITCVAANPVFHRDRHAQHGLEPRVAREVAARVEVAPTPEEVVVVDIVSAAHDGPFEGGVFSLSPHVEVELDPVVKPKVGEAFGIGG